MSISFTSGRESKQCIHKKIPSPVSPALPHSRLDSSRLFRRAAGGGCRRHPLIHWDGQWGVPSGSNIASVKATGQCTHLDDR